MKLPRYIARRRARLARSKWRGSDPALDKLRADLATAGVVWKELQVQHRVVVK